MTGIVHHPEYGPCVWVSFPCDQRPLSWRHVAWRAPRRTGPLRVRSVIHHDELVRLATVVTLIHDRGMELVASGRLSHPTMPRMRWDEPTNMPHRTLVREWRGTIDSRSDEIDILPSRSILIIQQRLGELAFHVARGFGKDSLIVANTSLPTVMNGPIDALKHLYALAQKAIEMPQTSRRDMRDENRAIGTLIATAACSIMPYRPDWSIAGGLSMQDSPMRRSIFIGAEDVTDAILPFAACPMLDDEIRRMRSVDAEHRFMEMDGSIGISLEGPPQIDAMRIERPSPIETLRMVERNEGEPLIMRDPDPVDPGHPRNQWLMPLDTARAFGMAV